MVAAAFSFLEMVLGSPFCTTRSPSGALLHFFGVPLLKQTTEKRYPYSNLCTGGPRPGLDSVSSGAKRILSIHSLLLWMAYCG